MLLSIDRVLQLLAEGKSTQKIAEMAEVKIDDVHNVIEEARKLLLNHEKTKTRRKIIIKKRESKNNSTEEEKKSNEDWESEEIFHGAELSAVPLGSSLLMYTAGVSDGNPGHSGISIVITDKEDRTVGKVSSYIGMNTGNVVPYFALIRALKIAIYFKTKNLKIRTDSEITVKQVKGEYKVVSEIIEPYYKECMRLKKLINSCRIEFIPKPSNDKADYLAKKSISERKQV